MKETELAKIFIDYFDDEYEIFKEVPCNGIADFVAKRGKTTICVEVKLSLNFDVIGQAHNHLKLCNYSYIAIPKVKVNHFGFDICRMLGIGVLMYYGGGIHIAEPVKPKLNRHTGDWLIKNLKPYMKASVAGSQTERITAFGNTVIGLTQYVRRNQGCTLEECLNNIEYHWSSFAGAKRSVYGYIKDGIIKDVIIVNGKLYLNNKQ